MLPRGNWMRRGVGAAATFSGAALLVHIASGLSLPMAVGLAALVAFGAIASRLLRAGGAERAKLRTRAGIGAAGGVLATIGYDITRTLLSRLDPTRYDPLEVIRIFGELLVGPQASLATRIAAGSAFHVLNGVCFGIAFCLLFSGPGIVLGVAWGLMLEMVQLAIYPGWLNIRFLSEFAQISASSHLVYGAILGLWCARQWRPSLGDEP